jgi:hypothetical protein
VPERAEIARSPAVDPVMIAAVPECRARLCERSAVAGEDGYPTPRKDDLPLYRFTEQLAARNHQLKTRRWLIEDASRTREDGRSAATRKYDYPLNIRSEHLIALDCYRLLRNRHCGVLERPREYCPVVTSVDTKSRTARSCRAVLIPGSTIARRPDRHHLPIVVKHLFSVEQRSGAFGVAAAS